MRAKKASVIACTRYARIYVCPLRESKRHHCYVHLPRIYRLSRELRHILKRGTHPGSRRHFPRTPRMTCVVLRNSVRPNSALLRLATTEHPVKMYRVINQQRVMIATIQRTMLCTCDLMKRRHAPNTAAACLPLFYPLVHVVGRPTHPYLIDCRRTRRSPPSGCCLGVPTFCPPSSEPHGRVASSWPWPLASLLCSVCPL